MRNGLAVFTAVCLTSFSLGCGSSNNNNPTPQAPAQTGSAAGEKKAAVKTWALQLQSKCGEEVAAGECLAEHGFTVTSDGKWKTGKTPEGYERSGDISNEDLTALSGTLEKALKQSGQSLKKLAAEDIDQPQTETTAQTVNAAQSEDVITLTEGSDNPKILVKALGGGITSSLNSEGEAKALHSAMRGLAERYYPRPFPDVCSDGGALLNTLINSAQACQTDADCTYVRYFTAVDAEDGGAIETDKGTIINPISVANKSSLETNVDKLSSLFNDVEVACGDTFYRDDAFGSYKAFVANGKAPVCKANVCQANPEVQFL